MVSSCDSAISNILGFMISHLVSSPLDDLCIAIWISQNPDDRETGYSNVLAQPNTSLRHWLWIIVTTFLGQSSFWLQHNIETLWRWRMFGKVLLVLLSMDGHDGDRIGRAEIWNGYLGAKYGSWMDIAALFRKYNLADAPICSSCRSSMLNMLEPCILWGGGSLWKWVWGR